MMFREWCLHEAVRMPVGSELRGRMLREIVLIREDAPKYKDVDQAEADLLRQVHR